MEKMESLSEIAKASNNNKIKGIVKITPNDYQKDERPNEIHSNEIVSKASQLSVNERIKIWQKNLESNKIGRHGDAVFTAARSTFIRLRNRFPLPEEIQLEMMLLCFSRRLMATVNRIFSDNVCLSCDEMWDKLADVFYNESQIQAHNSQFMRTIWNEATESIQEYADGLRSLGGNLNVGQQMMKAAFVQGLPRRLQAYVYGDRGSFDAVVAYTSTLVASGLVKKTEGVREVTETAVPPASNTKHHSNKVCFGCGGVGHFARDPVCPRRNNKVQDSTKHSSPNESNKPKDEKKNKEAHYLAGKKGDGGCFHKI